MRLLRAPLRRRQRVSTPSCELFQQVLQLRSQAAEAAHCGADERVSTNRVRQASPVRVVRWERALQLDVAGKGSVSGVVTPRVRLGRAVKCFHINEQVQPEAVKVRHNDVRPHMRRVASVQGELRVHPRVSNDRAEHLDEHVSHGVMK